MSPVTRQPWNRRGGEVDSKAEKSYGSYPRVQGQGKIRNPKSETSLAHEIQSSKRAVMLEPWHLTFRISDLFRISDFVLRICDHGLLALASRPMASTSSRFTS